MSRWRGLSPAARVLVANGLAFNLGFYMLMPYLAQHLGADLGLAGWITGLVMGLRVFSQQGLFLLGGWLGDRLGYRRAIVWGCCLRGVGFVLLGWAQTLPLLLLAAFLTGFAGALFTPCAQASLAAQCPDQSQRRYAFTLHNVASEAGMLLGPLVGLVLLHVDFRLTGCVAGALFLAFAALQWTLLPPDQGAPKPSSQLASGTAPASPRSWLAQLAEPSLLRFVGFCATYQVMFHQLYLAVPAFVQQHGLGSSALSAVFTLSAVVGIALQWPVSRWLVPRLGDAAAMGGGLALMGSAFLSPLVLAAWPQAAMLVLATLLSLGSILCFPLFATVLPRYARDCPLGTCYGFMSSVGGCAALVGQAAVGAGLGDHAAPTSGVWLALAACGVVGGLGLWRVTRTPGTPRTP
ncbi:MFS transporter [Rhodoferax sp.]|uniref:MFS transporter n=1 Tax=Rhodoferax sp. TaxID=50421 RepID=UPI002ACD83A6|nr:MFS transporter [Rhodoferax sp.]MDZ7921202.1 MFS transporter [Rhodoferax sp.]